MGFPFHFKQFVRNMVAYRQSALYTLNKSPDFAYRFGNQDTQIRIASHVHGKTY